MTELPVSREQLQRAYDAARAAGAGHERAVAIVARLYAMDGKAIACELEQQHAGT